MRLLVAMVVFFVVYRGGLLLAGARPDLTYQFGWFAGIVAVGVWRLLEVAFED